MIFCVVMSCLPPGCVHRLRDNSTLAATIALISPPHLVGINSRTRTGKTDRPARFSFAIGDDADNNDVEVLMYIFPEVLALRRECHVQST